tara:strand:- start:368 stop:571 length:204 start_codon:yes stop_codon:yes gene_type:complete
MKNQELAHLEGHQIGRKYWKLHALSLRARTYMWEGHFTIAAKKVLDEYQWRLMSGEVTKSIDHWRGE